MRKMIIFTFLAITILTYSNVKEVVKDAEGNNIVLMEDKTWELEKKVESKKEFENKVKLSNLEMSPKRSDGRSLTGSITNQSRKKLEYVTYNVIWKIDGQDSIVKTFTIKDLDYKETREFNKRIQLRYISGRDYKIEILDFKWED